MSLFNFFKAKKNIKSWSEKSIVIFSEGNVYNTTNKPVIDELIKDIDVLYITIDKDDELLLFNHEKFHPVYLEFDFWGQLLMATIKGRLLITTTPSLNVLALKKSPNMLYYSYFMHSPTDLHYYQKYSFDFFDSVVCIGEFQLLSLKELEEKRKTALKEKIVIGLPYYDIYIKELTVVEKNNKTILIAPSWGSNNFLNYIDYDLFEIVYNAGYNIIYRPHPMSYKYEQEKINSILEKYGNGYNGLRFELDKCKSPVKSIIQSSAMISAHSGMVIDYLVLSQGMLLFYDIERKIDNLENIDMISKPWDAKIIDENAFKIYNKEGLEECLNKLQTIHNSDSKITDIINIGCSADKIADFYINKFRKLQG